MISLARANLVHDWRRHLAAIVVLVLAGLLMIVQLGLVLGFLEGASELQRQVRADLAVRKSLSLNIASAAIRMRFGNLGLIQPSEQGMVWMHPEVESVEGYSKWGSSVTWSSPTNPFAQPQVIVIDPDADSLSFPRDFPDSLRPVLATPGMVVLPRATARSLGAQLGDTVPVGGFEITVGGIVNGISGAFGDRVIASPQTARLMGAGPGAGARLLLVKVKDPVRADAVVAELNRLVGTRGLKASRVEAISEEEGLTQLLQGPGLILLGSAAFAMLIGCGIASQTLRAAFLAQLKEFGALRALGVKRSRLALIAMEQAGWIGLVSGPLAIALAFIIRMIAGWWDVPIALPPELLAASAGLLLVVALIAGVISLTAVTRVEPAELLR